MKEKLTQHLKKHIGTPEKCEECDKRFITATQLKWHLVREHSDRPYKCRYCEKRFIYPQGSYTHELYNCKKKDTISKKREQKSPTMNGNGKEIKEEI